MSFDFSKVSHVLEGDNSADASAQEQEQQAAKQQVQQEQAETQDADANTSDEQQAEQPQTQQTETPRIPKPRLDKQIKVTKQLQQELAQTRQALEELRAQQAFLAGRVTAKPQQDVDAEDDPEVLAILEKLGVPAPKAKTVEPSFEDELAELPPKVQQELKYLRELRTQQEQAQQQQVAAADQYLGQVLVKLERQTSLDQDTLTAMLATGKWTPEMITKRFAPQAAQGAQNAGQPQQNASRATAPSRVPQPDTHVPATPQKLTRESWWARAKQDLDAAG